MRDHRSGHGFLATVAAGVAVLALVLTASVAQTQTSGTLYHRLGGYDAIAAVTDDFIVRLAGDPQLGKFFVGHSQDSIKRIRQNVVDLICEGAGGPCKYTGRDMKTAHKGLGISDAEWQAAGKHLVESLDKFKVPEREKNEVLASVNKLKGDIVEKP